MSSEPHYHEWKYNEAERAVVMEKSAMGQRWQVTRFCTQCHEVETIELKDKEK